MRAVFFDLDQTLIDRHAAVRTWLATMVEAEDLADLLRMDGGGYGSRERFFAAVAAQAGCQPQQARERFRAEVPLLVRCFPGASDLLARLSGRHVLGLVSNGDGSMQRAKLRGAGLEDAFDVVAISGEVGVAKPEARIFAWALERAGVGASATLFVGDHPVNDIAGARSAGLTTCWIRDQAQPPPVSDYSVDQLPQVWELVA